MQYVWLIWSLILLLLWYIIYTVKKEARSVMLKMSLITMPFGLTEPLFVPEYWIPPSLFDLAKKTGFDIESLIFSFSIGGIGAVLYNLIFSQSLEQVTFTERSHQRHRMHRYILSIPAIVFLSLSLFTTFNHIYCGSIAMLLGGLATLYCRPDLKRKIWTGGLLFTILYFIYFGSILPFYPNYVELYWNLNNLSHILVLGIPIEELLFAFTFGMYWSGLYEHLYWHKPTSSNKTIIQ